jgi:hypothetical protein
MTDVAIRRSFLVAEAEALAPFDALVVAPAGEPLQMVEMTRAEDGRLEVRVPGRPPIVPPLAVAIRSALRDRGFASQDAADPTQPWVRGVESAAAAVDLAQQLLVDVFGQKGDVALDVTHGSHRAEHETQQKLAALRERIERVLAEQIGRTPERDRDGDYVLAIGGVQVQVAPRAGFGVPLVVRVFAVTNVGVTVSPDLGLFLARLNFGLMFGRFALDAEHAAIWFDETLLGDQFTDEALRFTIKVVASTADEWDDRLKQMFGGATHHEIVAGKAGQPAPTTKPGGAVVGGYV